MRIMVFGGRGASTNAVVHALSEQYDDIMVLFEDAVPRAQFLKKRIKKLGLRTVIGQVAFVSLIPRHLRRVSRKRIREIVQFYHLDQSDKFSDRVRIHTVSSINNDETIAYYNDFKPDVIVVNGTRIIAGSILDRIHVPIINMHAGITPKYRGSHGGYWAVVNDDKSNCGVTIHFVNKGIDTGGVIRQKRIETTSEDNFVTYPLLQTGEGIKLELEVLKELEETGKIETISVDLPSMIWSHPTLFQYLKNIRKSR